MDSRISSNHLPVLMGQFRAAQQEPLAMCRDSVWERKEELVLFPAMGSTQRARQAHREIVDNRQDRGTGCSLRSADQDSDLESFQFRPAVCTRGIGRMHRTIPTPL